MGRFELKYLLPVDQKNLIIDYACNYCDVDGYVENGLYYYVSSLYYDSKDLDLYYQNIDGQPYRKKIRLRSYGEEFKTPWYLEVKEKRKSKIYKRKLDVTGVLFNECFIENLDSIQMDNVVLDEIRHLNDTYRLIPIVYTQYKRQAFFAKNDPKFRLTIDSELSSALLNNSYPDIKNKKMFKDDHLCIIELKGEGRLPFWAIQMIKKYSLQATKYSKYVAAVNSQNIHMQLKGKEND